MRTIILRFSNAELEEKPQDTVAAHNEIIRAHGATWWGWWKKTHEAFRGDLLHYIQEHSTRNPLPIGLLNRKGQEQLYEAICTDCRFDNGRSIKSPDPGLTPSYYSAESFPAWFKLTQIRTIERESFLRAFGDIPSLDPTLYEVLSQGDRLRVIPSRNWHMNSILTRGEAIVHVSDMHFGEGHGFASLRPPSGHGLARRPLSEVVANAIRDLVDVPVGAVVASGDFISKGDANSYPVAEEFLRDLLKSLQLQTSHCVLVPGNHDLWTENVPHPTRDYGHEAGYRMFVKSFLGEDIQDLESVRRLRTPGGMDLVFVALNSARIRSDTLREYGYVSRHRYEELLKYVTRTLTNDPPPSKKTLVFSTLHHHVVPIARIDIPEAVRPVSLTLDAGELIEQFTAAGVGYVLHGHQHLPFAGSAAKFNVLPNNGRQWSRRVSRDSLYVLACGSTGAKWEWLPHEVGQNMIAVYIPQTDRLSVTFIQFLPMQSHRIYWKGAVPLRNFHASRSLRH